MPDRVEINHPFEQWAKAAQNRLGYAYDESSSVLTHGGTIGSIRETVVRDILRRFLPNSLEIGKGQIVDSEGILSNQLDVIIARNTAPVLRFEGDEAAFFLETVIATIEVKSIMHQEKLNEALENIRSVKSLSYGLSSSSRGCSVYNEALRWIESFGGIQLLEGQISDPGFDRTLNLPEHLEYAMPFVRTWLHWKSGDFETPQQLAQTMEKMGNIINDSEFDFFVAALKYVTGVDDTIQLLTKEFSQADEIEERFFKTLCEFVMLEHLLPAGLILAFRGYRNPKQMILTVRNWLERNRDEVEWYMLPRLIMNDQMVMYRLYNTFHCHRHNTPVLFLLHAIGRAMSQDYFFPATVGFDASLIPYFDLNRIFPGEKHPKFRTDYLYWEIPLNNSDIGNIKRLRPSDSIWIR